MTRVIIIQNNDTQGDKGEGDKGDTGAKDDKCA